MARVLVVDDKDADRKTMVDILERGHWKVAEAKGPDEALGKFQSFHPDVAVIDYRCRNSLDHDDAGLEVATKGDPQVPKIFVSGLAERAEIMRAVPYGAKFLDKRAIDSDPEALLGAVREALDQRVENLRVARSSIPAELSQRFRTVHKFMIVEAIVLVATSLFLMAMTAHAFVFGHQSPTATLFTVSGAIFGELLVILNHKRHDPLRESRREYDQHLLMSAKFDQVLAACDSLESMEARDAAKKKLISGRTAQIVPKVFSAAGDS
jgi:CheY-like chemotaxis protein